jgi:[ribosomal protein S5]-alanine N-acetyltransferase
VIVTSRLELHPFTVELASAIAAEESRGRHWALGFPREDDRDAAEMFLRAPSDEFGSFEIRSGETKEAIGTIGFFGPPDEEGTVMIGYGLVEQARGSGYATEALRALVAYALERPQVNAMVADPELDNTASHRVLEKSGFSRTGQTETAASYTLVR